MTDADIFWDPWWGEFEQPTRLLDLAWDAMHRHPDSPSSDMVIALQSAVPPHVISRLFDVAITAYRKHATDLADQSEELNAHAMLVVLAEAAGELDDDDHLPAVLVDRSAVEEIRQVSDAAVRAAKATELIARYTQSIADAAEQRREAIAELEAAGHSRTFIAKLLGVTKGRITQVTRHPIADADTGGQPGDPS